MSGTITKATVTLLLWIPATLAAAQQPTQNVFHANKRSELVPPMDFPSNPLLRNKRPEIDLQTCIDNFNVHRDKIIRTQDSQNMGAKYLNEIDLGSRVECLKLCCETEDCDVFVFEEKVRIELYLNYKSGHLKLIKYLIFCWLTLQIFIFFFCFNRVPLGVGDYK